MKRKEEQLRKPFYKHVGKTENEARINLLQPTNREIERIFFIIIIIYVCVCEF